MTLNGTMPLWSAARALLHERLDDFDRRLANVLHTFDPEAIHDLRVSSRRLREGLALFAPCYPPADIVRIGKRIRKVTRLLGDIRNRDEALLFFVSLQTELEVSCRSDLDRLVTHFRNERQKDLQRLEAGFRRIAAAELHALCLQTISYPALLRPAAGIDLFAPLAGFAGEALSSRLNDVLQLVPEARKPGNTVAQHQLRIAVKHFRYRLELLSFMLGHKYKELYGAVKQYQELLGKMHDLDVFAAICREAALNKPAAVLIPKAIAARRRAHFADFTTMLATVPFEKIGSLIRKQL